MINIDPKPAPGHVPYNCQRLKMVKRHEPSCDANVETLLVLQIVLVGQEVFRACAWFRLLFLYGDIVHFDKSLRRHNEQITSQLGANQEPIIKGPLSPLYKKHTVLHKCSSMLSQPSVLLPTFPTL